MKPFSHCRFCEIPVDKQNPKLNNLTTQLIQYNYIDEFFFYFSKPINEIVGECQSPEYVAYREMQVEVSRPKLDFAYYNPKDCWKVIGRKACHSQSRLPILADYKAMETMVKVDFKKNNLDKLKSDEVDEKKRYVRKRQQLPLRDGNVLSCAKAGFVDLESFETKLFDIYDPSFSSVDEEKQAPMKSVLIERLKRGAYPREAGSGELTGPLKPKGKVQIPLLCLAKTAKTIKKGWPNQPESMIKVKQQTSQDPMRSKVFASSENQSTQFSVNCNLNHNGRRKQVLDSSKPTATRNSNSTKPPIKLLSTSPKFLKKKKVNIDSSLKPSKKTRRSKDHENQKQILTTTNSLFNSRSWKVMKSWDQFMIGKFKDNQPQESTRTRLESRQSKKRATDSKDKKGTSQFLQYSTDNTKLGLSKYQVVVGASITSKKNALSPRHGTERALTHRETIYNSFKEKCNFKNAKQRGNRFPLWIGMPEADEKKSTREFIKPEGSIGLNTQTSLKSKRFEVDISKLPFDCGIPHNLKDLRSRIHRDRNDNPLTQSTNFINGTRLLRNCESKNELKSCDKIPEKQSLLKSKSKGQRKKTDLAITEWSKIALLAADKVDMTSHNHFLTSRSCRMKERENTRIATERCADRPEGSQVGKSGDRAKQKTAKSVKKGC